MSDKNKGLYPGEFKIAMAGTSKRPNLYSTIVSVDNTKSKEDWTTYLPISGSYITTTKDYKVNIEQPFKYIFNEPIHLQEILEHINNTYKQHYSKGKYQATDVIIDLGHGDGFNVGNAIKYLSRYGKKEGYNKADLLKAIHYIVIQLDVHDKEHSN